MEISSSPKNRNTNSLARWTKHRAANDEHERALKLRRQLHIPPAAGKRENDAG